MIVLTPISVYFLLKGFYRLSHISISDQIHFLTNLNKIHLRDKKSGNHIHFIGPAISKNESDNYPDGDEDIVQKVSNCPERFTLYS